MLASSNILAKSPTKITHERYVGGAVASIFLGFGIGQAIQGRYKESGWIFTVAELGALGLIGGAMFMVKDIYAIPRMTATQLSGELGFAGLALAGLGAVAWAGFRAWEVMDTWVIPVQQDRVAADILRDSQQKLAFSPVLAPNYAGIALQF